MILETFRNESYQHLLMDWMWDMNKGESQSDSKDFELEKWIRDPGEKQFLKNKSKFWFFWRVKFELFSVI